MAEVTEASMTARQHAERAAAIAWTAADASLATRGTTDHRQTRALEVQAHALTAIALTVTELVGDTGNGSIADQIGWALDRATNAIADAAAQVSADSMRRTARG